nr:unnamed protein product [Digitaria exilis]
MVIWFSARQVLDEMRPKVSVKLMREVLFRIIVSVDSVNRERYPKLAYRFFVWAGQQEGYRHNTSTYNLVMKVFAQCGEVKAMWRLFEEMAEKGLPVSARTFHLLICASGQVGLRRRLRGCVTSQTLYHFCVDKVTNNPSSPTRRQPNHATARTKKDTRVTVGGVGIRVTRSLRRMQFEPGPVAATIIEGGHVGHNSSPVGSADLTARNR